MLRPKIRNVLCSHDDDKEQRSRRDRRNKNDESTP
jgi:hypothetical protein